MIGTLLALPSEPIRQEATGTRLESKRSEENGTDRTGDG